MTTTDMLPAISRTKPATAEPLTDADAHAIHEAKARATWKAYATDWVHFEAWCEREGRGALPATPGTITAYLHALVADGYKTSTITGVCPPSPYATKAPDGPPPPPMRLCASCGPAYAADSGSRARPPLERPRLPPQT
jgi:hypothetical protein